MSSDLERRLVDIASQARWFSEALMAVRALGLQSWCIGAGAVRNLVWDHLHGFPLPTPLSDLDVAYFDSADLSAERDLMLQTRLQQSLPGVPWEVLNQAGVHQWFEACFGHPAAPLHSLEEAVASWPEFATAVGIWMSDDGALRVIAPHGLNDLFAMVVRRNPLRVSVDTFRRRLEQKRYADRWPAVRVEYA